MRVSLTLALLVLAASLPAASGDGETWASPTQTAIRPGVKVFTAGAQCTTNFVFVDNVDASVYIGTAAHCVANAPDGSGATFNVPGTGKVVYSSWRTMDRVGETDQRALAYNDFALIRVDEAYVHRVNPAMRHFGGPVGMADTRAIEPGQKVLTYGNSGMRPDVDPLHWHEGYVVNEAPSWNRYVLTATPGIFGDSGSGIMTGDGQAMGIVVTLSYFGGTNGVTTLDDAVQYAREKGGFDIRLATWALLDAGVLPAPIG